MTPTLNHGSFKIYKTCWGCNWSMRVDQVCYTCRRDKAKPVVNPLRGFLFLSREFRQFLCLWFRFCPVYDHKLGIAMSTCRAGQGKGCESPKISFPSSLEFAGNKVLLLFSNIISKTCFQVTSRKAQDSCHVLWSSFIFIMLDRWQRIQLN